MSDTNPETNEWVEYYKARAEKAESILLKANDIHFRNDPPPSSPWHIESDKVGEYITNGHMWLRGFDKICEHLNSRKPESHDSALRTGKANGH